VYGINLYSHRSQRAARGLLLVDRGSKAASQAGGPGRLRRNSARVGFCRRLCSSSQHRSHPPPRPHSTQSRRGRRATTGRARMGTAISPNSRGWPASSARRISPNSANRRAHRRNHLPAVSHPSRCLVVWPNRLRLHRRRSQLQAGHAVYCGDYEAPLVVGGIGAEFSQQENVGATITPWSRRPAAMVGRYGQIHLVPREYIRSRICSPSSPSDGRSRRSRGGSDHRVSSARHANGGRHRYGVFICYEHVFAMKWREAARNGARSWLTSSDGWYATPATLEHLTWPACAPSKRRWSCATPHRSHAPSSLRAGVRESIPRHRSTRCPRNSLRDGITSTTAHGDVFAWLLCVAESRDYGLAGSSSLASQCTSDANLASVGNADAFIRNPAATTIRGWNGQGERTP